MEAIAEADMQTSCRSVVYTYNYPVIFFEYSVNVDLKTFTERLYKLPCSAELTAAKETLAYITHETDVWFEITTLLIPGKNACEAEIEALNQCVVQSLGPDGPLYFSAFHPDYKMANKPNTPAETLIRAWQIPRKNGVRYPYTGIIYKKVTGGSTYCHQCGLRLTGQNWCKLSDRQLTADAALPSCGIACAGVFDGESTHWGRKRQPVLIKQFAAATYKSLGAPR